ncbi:MotA/TolQ/ExbB proton channel family protein, partial [Sulfurovum sp. bin170]|uniref:MotA/TolQ/ExbB proton channel family protein n=1 Tax=Sulfurovum sp. bin170 TaxID=2695268 RepID=UPI0013DEA23F
NYAVIALLPTLFLTGIVLGYMKIISLKVDMHSLIIISLIYFIYLLFIQHNANYAICNMRKSYIHLQQQLQKNIKSNSLTIGDETKSTINIEDYILEYYKTFRNDNFASVAPSFFPMLGILGTFTAIAISMPDFSIQESSALDSEISILLSGIGTAFYASIFGIFLSILWNYFEKRGLSKADQDKHHLQNVYSEFIWTDSELKRHEHSQHEMRDAKMIDALKETFNLEFIQMLNQQHMENFQTIIDETNRNFTNITTHMKMVSTDLQETISKVHKSNNALTATQKIDDNLRKFILTTDKLHNSIDKFDNSLENSLNITFHKIDDELGDIIIKLGNFATSISEQNRVLQDTVSRYHTEISNSIGNRDNV